MERMDGDFRLLQSQVKGSLDIMASTMQSFQADMREIAKEVGGLSQAQSSHESDRKSIGRLEVSVNQLGERLDKHFERALKENEEWRLRHEAENENAERSLSDAIDAIKSDVNKAKGWIAAASAIGALTLSGFLWTANYRFTNVEEDIKNQDKIAERQERNSERIHELELFLARGGRVPEEPFKPQPATVPAHQSSEKRNGK